MTIKTGHYRITVKNHYLYLYDLKNEVYITTTEETKILNPFTMWIFREELEKKILSLIRLIKFWIKEESETRFH